MVSGQDAFPRSAFGLASRGAALLICFLAAVRLVTAAPAETPPAPGFLVVSAGDARIDELTRLAVSPDGNTLAVGTLAGTFDLWDWRKATMTKSIAVGDDLVGSMRFLGGGEHIAVNLVRDLFSSDGFVVEVATGKVEQSDETFRAKYHKVDVLSRSPDGKLIMAVIWDPFADLGIYDASGNLVQWFKLGYKPDRAALSADGRIIAAVQVDYGEDKFNPAKNGYDLLDVASRNHLHRLSGHKDRAYDGTFSPDGKRFLTWSEDGTLVLWDVGTGSQIRRFVGHRDGVGGGAFLDGGRLVASSGRDGSVKLWSASTGKELVSFYASEKKDPMPSYIAIRPDGHFVEGGPVRLTILSAKGGGQPLPGGDRAALKMTSMEVVDNMAP
jgi:WD40 repeat protein